MMKNFLSGLLMLTCAGLTSTATAGGMIYLGAGPGEDASDTTVDDTPFVFGGLVFPETSRMVFGFDIAGEGTMLDSTYGQDSLRQAISYNFLVGTNLSRTENVRVDASAILGIRESFADCPDSFLGFQCYADEAPDTEYEFNGGGLLTVSYKRASIGLRVTGESAMAVVGVNF